MNPRKSLSRPVGVIILLFGVALAGDLFFRTGLYYYLTGPEDSGLELVRLLSPGRITLPVGSNAGEYVEGAVFAANLTSAPGRNTSIEFQVGAGDVGVPLRLWTFWSPAAYSRDEAGSDIYRFYLRPPFSVAGEYRYAVRARLGGQEWVYGDLDGNVNGIQDSQLGRLLLTGDLPPPGVSCPDSLLFSFAYSENGWYFTAAGEFTAPEDQWTDTGGGALILRAANNTMTFGYFDSPYVDVVEGPSILLPLGRKPASASFLDYGSLYKAEFFVSASTEDRAGVPQFRLRTNSLNLQQGSYVAVESRSDGAFSPDADGQVYTLLFSQPPADGNAQFSFDLLNFDPRDDPEGALSLGWMRISRCEPVDLADAQMVYRYTFDANTEGWTPQTASQFTPPIFGHETGALTLTGPGAEDSFGYYVSPPGDIVIDSSLLYIAVFEVESDVPPEERKTVPQFRLRLNEEEYHTATVMAVESLLEGDNSPVDGEPMEYVAFFLPPPSSHGKSLLVSFDLLNFSLKDNTTATVKLNRVDIRAIPYP